MKKTTKWLAIIAVAALFVFSIVSCEGPAGNDGNHGDDGTHGNIHTVSYKTGEGGSHVDSEKVIDGGKIREPKNPTRPFAIGAVGLYVAGEYGGWIFTGWYKDGILFDFDAKITEDIELTAGWRPPGLVDTDDITAVPADNDFVEKAIAYVKANPGSYTLAIGRNYIIAGQTLDKANVNLTIIGLTVERTIKRSNNGALFTVGASGQSSISLTIGNNITLLGRNATDDTADNNDTIVTVQNSAHFFMLDGSKITKNTSIGINLTTGSAVNVHTAFFTMKGGAITGNTAGVRSDNYLSCAVHVYNGTFNMEGGNISGNTGFVGDVLVSEVGNPLSLDGSAAIGRLGLNSGVVGNTRISVGESWTGSVTKLNLRGNHATISGTIGLWNGKQILTGSSEAIANARTRIGLGDFLNDNTATQAIYPAYAISILGRLVQQ
ncbi:MAG: InlB B-repeat-containing protein [Treponema sp.]|jgi:hypothetical protein|nr:InlB B-repeat-containing protein [Treponema sp.]